ncbi:protein LOW PSII ACCUMULATION 1, chloroplastic isoform X1 [Coffea eugenioides]|uniref:protein LOW PSII ACCUMULATION 1, chloroplastic isoform X1 n=1 Tax=Coffea eugenioides TaxID=49369 RepID=UPI000F610A49|nr:protein LOW PSII ACCUMULATION 1, chloroplastic isoform X1 [Coffea eugenioides]XP_027148063.1 protein LOW PSII ACCUMULATION 1, chloroplastic isoform X1 [Coffea eugenioides]
MASAAQPSYSLIGCPSLNLDKKCLGFSRHLNNCRKFAFFFSNVDQRLLCKVQPRRLEPSLITCFASNKPEIRFSFTCEASLQSSFCLLFSSTAKIRSEVLSPFRSVRMFFYLAFVASGALGGLIATTQLIAALSNPSRAAEVPDILKGLGIDIGAVSVFALLYYRENTAKNAQLAKLSREESLSNLRIRVDEKRILPVSAFRGIARLVILAGPASFIADSFKSSEPFTDRLVERGVLVVPFATDGNSPSFEFEDSEELKEIIAKRKRLWQLAPVYATEWSEWLAEQKKLAGVSPESPVYLSLRMDGRVRGSGVGYPPWNAFVAQLPPVKGMWSGLLDGMDGRVL